MDNKLTGLENLLKELGSVVVAYSGGVDSTFLAVAAHRTLGQKSLAVTAASATYPRREIEDASSLAAEFGLRHIVIETDELNDPCFTANPPNRCYYCKGELFSRLRRIADEQGLTWVIDGSNVDDLGDHRPGRIAAAELGVRSPLCETGLTKAEIRALSQEWGLPTWDKPSLACLSSRLPYGTPITIEVLDRVSKAEEYLRSLGIRQLRVRHHDSMARIEVEPKDMAVLFSEPVRSQIVQRFRDLGYTYVTLDLSGYRTGSMNEVLKEVQ